jgi:PKD repeat protein
MTCSWNFGDGGTSSDQNPTHTYTATGTYTVSLTATNSLGTNTATTAGYITVTEDQPGGSHTGIALTFDDNYIDQWYTLRPLLQKYNAHATFFVAGFGNLDESQIEELRTLQADGNEIAFHGTHHTEAASYLQNHTVQQYLDYEIIPGLNLMKNAGFNPVDYAWPGGADAPAAVPALEGYFGHLRDTYYDWDDSIYYTEGSHQPLIVGIGIDDITYDQSMNINNIYNGISTAKNEDKILILYGHKPVTNVTALYETSYDRIDKILHYASANNMKTFTVSEIN